MKSCPRLLVNLMLAIGVVVCATTAIAQIDILSNQPLLGNGDAGADDPIAVSAEFSVGSDRSGELRITATVADSWHIYSITQASGGPIPSKIKIVASDRFRIVGDFRPSPPPQVSRKWPDNPALGVEEHHGKTTWIAPLEWSDSADLATAEVRGSLFAQACNEKECLPPKSYPFAAKLARSAGSQDSSAEREVGRDQRIAALSNGPSGSSDGLNNAAGRAGVYQGSHVELDGYVEFAGDESKQAKLVISATPADGWHIYSLADAVPEIGSKPTLIRLSSPKGVSIARRSVSAKPTVEAARDPSLKPVSFHAEPVTWTMSLDLPESGDESANLRGAIGFQTCADAGRCDLPEAAWFQATFDRRSAGAIPLRFSRGKYAEVQRLENTMAASDLPQNGGPAGSSNGSIGASAVGQATTSATSLFWVLSSAFVGGLILNFMPCVLPVIGLKILSFVEQAGKQRAQILLLNIYYSLGMLLVFLGLATLAVFLQNGWGEQNSNPTFNIAMAGLVFAMALSFLGVWEIPLPGFVGSGKAQELSEREGALGAITKGVITTLLATPCSGPMLGSVFGYTLTQPPMITYLIYSFIGLGMASPYLAIGAFPNLIQWLPRPGEWMNTFKHIMGFVMLGGVVVLLSFVPSDYVVATVGLLVSLWAGFWWINRTPHYAPAPKRFAAWTTGIAIAAIASAVSFWVFLPGPELIAWKPFSPQTLTQMSKEGKTVLVDFTANWCLTCKTNYKLAINTQDVAQVIERNGVVPLLADWTDGSEEIHDALRSLGSNSIPVLAIFPASRPQQPIILRDLLFKSDVLKALEEAGPSIGNTRPSITATASGK